MTNSPINYSPSIIEYSYQMILAYYQFPDQEPLPLDNIENQIRPAFASEGVRPLYCLRSKDILLIHSAIKVGLDLHSNLGRRVFQTMI